MSGKRKAGYWHYQGRSMRKRVNHTLATKLEVIERYERGETRTEISKAMGIAGSSIYSMYTNAEAIKEQAKRCDKDMLLANKVKDVFVSIPKYEPPALAVKKNRCYSLETKMEVVRLRKEGRSARDISQDMGIPYSTVFDMLKAAAKREEQATKAEEPTPDMIVPNQTNIEDIMEDDCTDLIVEIVQENTRKMDTMDTSHSLTQERPQTACTTTPSLTQEKSKSTGITPPSTQEKTRKSRRPHTLATTLEVLHRLESGESRKEVGEAMGLPRTTIFGILARAKKIKAKAQVAGVLDMSVNEVSGSSSQGSKGIVMENMERLLKIWVDGQLSQPDTLTSEAIKRKALTLWEFVWDCSSPEEIEGVGRNFIASDAWVEQFKKDIGLICTSLPETVHKPVVPTNLNHKSNVKVVFPMQRVTGVPKGFSSLLRAKIEVGGYTPRQVINLDEMGLYWKKLPDNTLITVGEEKGTASKYPLSLMLGANATGDLKLKPLLVFPTENPHSLVGYVKEFLPVIWRSHPGGRVVPTLCLNYVVDYISQRCKEYALEHNLNNKFLLVVGDGPAYPPTMDHLADNIQVMFIPTMTQSVVQPMDHGIVATFRRCYLHRLMEQVLREIEVDNKESLAEFWDKYNIKNAVNNIKMAWDDVTPSTVNAAWKSIWPECVHDSLGCLWPGEPTEQDIVGLAHQAGFLQVTANNIHELLQNPHEEMSGEDLLVESDQTLQEHDMEEAKILDISVLHHALSLFDEAMGVLEDNDPNCSRSCDARSCVERGIRSYRELYATKKKKAENVSIYSPDTD